MRNPFTTRTAKSARTRHRSLTLLGVLVALAAIAGYAIAAPRGPAVAAPSITSGPSGTTRATAASFAFRGERGATFECSLDDASFRACTSPKSYSGLGSGRHEFEVRARNARGQLSSPASRSWTIDVSAPSIDVRHPDHGEHYGVERWDDGCPGGARICGEAEDRSGVEAVSVSIRRISTGLYWNGRAFASATQVFLPASGSESWRLTMPLPAINGAYGIRVRAVDELGNATAPGAERSVTFLVDRSAPPAPVVEQGPPNPSNDDDADFVFADAERGVRFVCRLDTERDYGRCDDHETFHNLRDGLRTLSVRAVDEAGNVSDATYFSWRIDTQAPPKPSITQKPTNPSSASSATFAFRDSERGVGFECRLDRGTWTVCTSPTTYTGLANGRHTFSVRAVDAAGNRSGSADYDWTVTSASTVGEDFTVRGGFDGLLSPGVSGPLTVTVTNPNDEPILVTSLVVTIQPGSTRAGCDGPANLDVTPSNASEANPLMVPPNGSVTLPAGGVSAPQVEMLNLPTNQDACKGALFTFTYGGSAHS
ncbi:MAG TPA: hypothetical protein VK506_15425 [Conexibacter sp.]|nr:hypothetical protein [Conexibacter sp.]